MKETLNVNIASQAFVIDQDAYNVLQAYLDDISSRFDQDDKDTMDDIETRLAEIFREKLPSPMMVISLPIVRMAMAQMGKPEEFGEPHASCDDSDGDSNTKRFVRPVYDRVIGGVCAGIARYFNADLFAIRLVTLLLILFGGISIWVYIILWIVMPSEKPAQSRKTTKQARQ